MKVTLKDNPLLYKNNLPYAESIEGEIIDRETLRLTQRYNINRFELILIDAKPLASFKISAKGVSADNARRLLLLKLILKGKNVYFSRPFMNSGCFEFTPPEQITFEIEKPNSKKLQKINSRFQKKQKAASVSKAHIEKITGFLAEINREAIKGLVTSAKRDFDFIVHFNSEMFHQNLTAKGLSFTKETVTGIYEEEKYTKIIDLSDMRERMGFISLYAITFCGLSLNDLYSVDGIFTLQPNREADDKKRLAGQEVFELVFNENSGEIKARAFKMTGALKNLPLPEININITGLIKKNYTLYCGIGDIGRVFSRLILSDDKNFTDSLKIARRLSFYKLLEKYCDEIANTSLDYDFEKRDIYKNIKAFVSAAEGKKTAGELDFTVK